MHKARYWLLLKIAKLPKVFTYGVGALAAFLVFMAAVTTTIWLDTARMAKQHEHALGLYAAAIAESGQLLQHLFSHDDLGCNPADLLHLNAHLLKSHYLREIGIMNVDGALACSTALGILDTPIKGGYPVKESRSGLKILVNVPLAISDKSVLAVIVQDPPFNTVVSPFVVDEIYRSADVVWMHTVNGLILMHTDVPPDVLEEMQSRAVGSTGPGFSLHTDGYELLTAGPQPDLLLQTHRSLAAIAADNPFLFPGALLGALLIGGLTTAAVSPHVRKLAGLQNRLEYLCDERYLTLEYQPIFDLDTLKPVGCEVLARLSEGQTRWMPDSFISALQENELEQQFDHAVARKAIRELSQHLPRLPDDFAVALNFFPRSVKPHTLLPVLNEAMNASDRADFHICIEIVEHALSTDLLGEVECLKSSGFEIAVDDFGTGYSNLRAVTMLSPQRLKIDRSFVSELEEQGLRSNLIAEIVDIARAVNAQTIAEGIETMRQVRLLTLAGVRYGQGFGLARPMPVTELGAMLRQSFVAA